MTVEETIAEYSAAWSELDPVRRQESLRRTVVEDVAYCDPGARVTGLDALGEVIAGVQQQFPGAVLIRTTDVDRHHDCIRFGWRFVGADGAALLDGIDVCTVAEDGRLGSFIVFFGELAAAD